MIRVRKLKYLETFEKECTILEEDMLDSEQTVFSQEEFYIKEETFENEGEIEEKYDFDEEKHDFDEKYEFDEKYDFEQNNHDFDVKQEEKTFDNTKTYECDFCDKKFSRPENVTRHIKSVHEGKKPYTCEECGRNFTEKRNLEHHNESYHAPRNLKCEMGCQNLKFATNKQLKYHMLSVHEKEKPFNCNLCDYSSVTKSNFNRHVSDVHEDNR